MEFQPVSASYACFTSITGKAFLGEDPRLARSSLPEEAEGPRTKKGFGVHTRTITLLLVEAVLCLRRQASLSCASPARRRQTLSKKDVASGAGRLRCIERSDEGPPLSCIQSADAPVRKRLIDACQRTFQHKPDLLEAAAVGLQRSLGLACQTKVKFFTERGSQGYSHSFFV